MTDWWRLLPAWRQILISVALLALIVALFVLLLDAIGG